jgi:hypothetical protein
VLGPAGEITKVNRYRFADDLVKLCVRDERH